MTKIPKKYWPFDGTRCIECGSWDLHATWDGQIMLEFQNGNLKLRKLHVNDVEVIMQCMECDCEFKQFMGDCYRWTNGPPNMNEPVTWKDKDE